MAKSDCFISVVAPIRDDSAVVEPFIRETVPILEQHFKNYELVLVDDGSQDDSVERIACLLRSCPGIRVLRLSRRFGSDVAISAGLESVIGDYVVVMLPYMDPPEVIPALVERSIAGSDVVFGVSTAHSGQGRLYRAGSMLFHLYCQRVLKVKLPVHATQLRCLSRRALNAITRIKDSHRYLRLYSAYVGYAQQEFLYTPVLRASGARRRTLVEAVKTGIDLIVENTRHPLRIVTWTGVAIAVLNIMYTIFITIVYSFNNEVLPGWSSLSFQNSIQFLLLTLMFTIQSEYVGRIVERMRDRPYYFLVDEQTSSVLPVDKDQYNILTSAQDSQPVLS